MAQAKPFCLMEVRHKSPGLGQGCRGFVSPKQFFPFQGGCAGPCVTPFFFSDTAFVIRIRLWAIHTLSLHCLLFFIFVSTYFHTSDENQLWLLGWDGAQEEHSLRLGLSKWDTWLGALGGWSIPLGNSCANLASGIHECDLFGESYLQM